MLHLPNLFPFSRPHDPYEKAPDEPKKNYLEGLPNELLLIIISSLEFTGLINLNGVNKQFYEMTHSDTIWMPFLKRIHISHLKKENISCKQVFVNYTLRLDQLSKRDHSCYIQQKCKKPNTINNINYLSEYVVARDKFLIQNELQENYMGVSKPLFSKRKTVLKKSKGFSKYFISHQTYIANDHRLFLNRMALSAIPVEIICFQTVQVLILSENYLEKVPHEIGKLTSLHYLDLSKNKLKKISEKIKTLTNLQTLKINRNLLSTLPKSLYELPRLERLSIYQNPLTEETVADLSKLHLKKIALSKNQVSLKHYDDSQNEKTQIKIKN